MKIKRHVIEERHLPHADRWRGDRGMSFPSRSSSRGSVRGPAAFHRPCPPGALRRTLILSLSCENRHGEGAELGSELREPRDATGPYVLPDHFRDAADEDQQHLIAYLRDVRILSSSNLMNGPEERDEAAEQFGPAC